MMEEFIIGSYMICGILFILSLGGLSHQESSKAGNLYGVTAMILAIVATFFTSEFDYNFLFWGPAFLCGGILGAILALRVEMISMPQLVAALHSFVGLAATIVGFAFFILSHKTDILSVIETNIGVFIGSVTFTGSVVAWGKLQGCIRSSPLIICGFGRHIINLVLILVCIGLAVYFALVDDKEIELYLLLGVAGFSGFIGWHLVMAIGGADMPVVVSMLNSYSGWATSASGFLLENQLLIITGALVGSSGAILSYIMCRAMNRSFFNVIAGGFGAVATSADGKSLEGEMIPCTLQDVLHTLLDAQKIVIVPGYGMAVAHCEHDVGTLAEFLKKSGREVSFCIHPVAGRLPGHMNVLLAEADVDYKIVKEMDHVNPDFPDTDITLVIGANDIVNPDALENPNSPIAGMPVCEVWKGKKVIVFKRGGGTGYAGIENPLFVKENTRMYFGSADKSIKDILNEVTAHASSFNSSGIYTHEDKSEKSSSSETSSDEEFEEIMTLGVPKEIFPLEKRVAITPQTVKKFRKLGFKVKVERLAGAGADFLDEEYRLKGAEIVETSEVWRSDIVLKVRKPEEHPELGVHEDTFLEEAKVLVSYVQPFNNKDWLEELGQRYPNLNYFAIDCVPRITKAQKLDSLSSMANIGGYRAVMEAFQYFKKCPKPMVTAAGKLPPAEVLVIGAGVAGLAAIGYSKNLGCVVKAMDTRPEAKTDAESMGAEFLEVEVEEEGTGLGGYAKVMSDDYQKAEYELTKKTAKAVDIIITTALIPGRPAPVLLDEEIVKGMKFGSVIVDMAAEMGGNCSLTRPDEVYITENGVTIVGFTDLVSRMAPQSSELYANNLWHFLDELGGAKKFKINIDDEIQRSMAVVYKGQMVWRAPMPISPGPKTRSSQVPKEIETEVRRPIHWSLKWIIVSVLLIGCFIGLSYATELAFMGLFMIFVLAIFIGYMVIWNVTPALHTPLMSVTNAISGIIVIGAMHNLTPNSDPIDEGSVLGILAVFLATINIWGGFIVTQRMLMMFKTRG